MSARRRTPGVRTRDSRAPEVPTPDRLVYLRLYEELNDYLPREKRKVRFEHPVGDGATLESVLASLGVPAEKVDVALLNGAPAALDAPLRPGDDLALYPVFEALDVADLRRLGGAPLRRPRFAVSPELQGLATWLRVLGLDARAFRPQAAGEPARILLAREPALHPGATHLLSVRGRLPTLQALRVLWRLHLLPRPVPRAFRRLRGG